MKRLRALAASSIIVLSLIATGVLGSTTASASSGWTCANIPPSSVECVRQVNGIPLQVDVNTTPPLTQNGLQFLLADVNNLLNRMPPPTAHQLADEIVLFLEQMGYHTCSVVVIFGSDRGSASCQ